MPRVLFLDTKPHIYSVLKRKFEREGFEVIAESQNQDADLIVRGKAGFSEPIVDAQSSVPIIILSDEQLPDEDSQAVTHLKMPFRPSELMLMARQAVTGAV